MQLRPELDEFEECDKCVTLNIFIDAKSGFRTETNPRTDTWQKEPNGRAEIRSSKDPNLFSDGSDGEAYYISKCLRNTEVEDGQNWWSKLVLYSKVPLSIKTQLTCRHESRRSIQKKDPKPEPKRFFFRKPEPKIEFYLNGPKVAQIRFLDDFDQMT